MKGFWLGTYGDRSSIDPGLPERGRRWKEQEIDPRRIPSPDRSDSLSPYLSVTDLKLLAIDQFSNGAETDLTLYVMTALLNKSVFVTHRIDIGIHCTGLKAFEQECNP